MTEIVSDNRPKYTPIFDEVDGVYRDKSPYNRYESNCIPHICPCNHREFCNNTQFNQHIKTKGHINFIKNYAKNNKELGHHAIILLNKHHN